MFHGNIWLKYVYSRNKKVPINFVAKITLHIPCKLYFFENRGVFERIYEQFGTAIQAAVSEHNMAWQKFDLHARQLQQLAV
jgi:hypothetical protein